MNRFVISILLVLLFAYLISSPVIAAEPMFNYGEAFQKALYFYDVQRSGPTPDNNRVEWKADSAMNDGKDIRPDLDLTGGWYDAGDHVKFGLPMAYSATMLAWGAIENRQAYEQSGQLQYLLDNLHVVNDYFIRAHDQGDPNYPDVLYGQVGQGSLDHTYWVAAEVMLMDRPAYKVDKNCPGSDVAGQTAAAMAAASMVFKPTEPAYADELLTHAKELFDFADNYRGNYDSCITDAGGFYASTSGYKDELIWSAAWLYKATGDQYYLDKAEGFAHEFGKVGQTLIWTQSWDDSTYGALLLLAQLTDDSDYKDTIENWLNYWSVGNSSGGRIPYTPGGLAYLNSWGVLRYSTTTAFLALIYSDWTSDPVLKQRYHDFALSQINYALGNNPQNRSYMVGFGNNPPTHPHHRTSHGSWENSVGIPDEPRHILYGALVGGPDLDDGYVDVRSDYAHNEVATDYNAGVTGALARLYREYGGELIANFPEPETRDAEIFVESRYSQQSAKSLVIHANVHNRSAWPARFLKNFSYRYFVDLSEVRAAGYDPSSMVVINNYCENCQVSDFQIWDAENDIYYVEVSFPDENIHPSGTVQSRRQSQIYIGFDYITQPPTGAWDPTNDWSFAGLEGSENMKISSRIPVYENGVKVFGEEPPRIGTTLCREDLNQDHVIDLSDYSILIDQFLQTVTPHTGADISGDGIVDLTDYSLLIARFYENC